MNHTDMEMMEVETTATGRPELPSSTGQGDVARDLLTLSRQLLNQGKPSQSLQAVVMAMRTRGGDEAVFQSLYRARELYRSRLQESSAADQLASLFAECAIVEAHPWKTEPEAACNVGGPSVGLGPDGQGSSIIAETGRMQIVLDAFSNGSSFICLHCRGIVSNHRNKRSTQTETTSSDGDGKSLRHQGSQPSRPHQHRRSSLPTTPVPSLAADAPSAAPAAASLLQTPFAAHGAHTRSKVAFTTSPPPPFSPATSFPSSSTPSSVLSSFLARASQLPNQLVAVRKPSCNNMQWLP
ncbi:hypothetical protein ACFX19_044679 [Malus domestica]